MALSNDYSLKFRKNNGGVETYYGYTSKVTNPSLAFRSSNGNVRYIPLTTSYSSSPLKVRYNNSIYGITRQSGYVQINGLISDTGDTYLWYLQSISLDFGFNVSTTVTLKHKNANFPYSDELVQTVSSFETYISLSRNVTVNYRYFGQEPDTFYVEVAVFGTTFTSSVVEFPYSSSTANFSIRCIITI